MFADKISISDVGSGYEYSLPTVKYIYETGGITLSSPVTFFTGENGVGKSTILEAVAIALGFNPEGGTKNFAFSTADSHSGLYESLVVSRTKNAKDGFFLRAESFYNVVSHIDELDRQPALSRKISESYGGRSLHTVSHGESFMALVENRFSGESLFILDEPEASLSPMRQISLLSQMHRLVSQGSQFIISTHSPILCAYPHSTVFELSHEGIKTVPWKESEIYKTTYGFLSDSEHILRYLFDSEQ